MSVGGEVPVPENTSVASLPDARWSDEPAAGQDTRLPFSVVAIGASAGGVEALQRLFEGMPDAPGCAFIVVMHLAQDMRSQLVSLLGRLTAMPVRTAEHGMPLVRDEVYVIPPGDLLEVRGGRCQLTSRTGHRGAKPVAVDRLMASLALDQGDRAIGVILSGTDGDGAIGIKAIKAEGGIVIAQLPSSAAHAGMPTSAVATGIVDRQMRVEDMPAALVAFARYERAPAADAAVGQADLGGVLETLRAQVSLDFSGYKLPMLQRRVRRRMGLLRLSDTALYVQQLKKDLDECNALAADFLISVTEFFREPEAWQTLARDVLPDLLKDKPPGSAVRAWVPGCATGEEAYSLAMVLLEDPRVAERRLKIQVFATDIDTPALDQARRARYPKAIENAVTSERLHRFFVKSDGGYIVRKELREVVTFAPQNLAQDPPFSRMDLISCRNLLIYLQPDLQRRVLQLFHFSLVPDGLLALGKSETVGPLASSFHIVSHTSRIFRRAGLAPAAALLVTTRFGAGTHMASVRDEARPAPAVPGYATSVEQALLEHRPTTAVLTNRDGQTLYFHGPVHRYLELPGGAPTVDLFAMLDQALRPQLRAALHLALTERRQVAVSVAVLREAGEQRVRLTVSPVAHPTLSDLLLVAFEELEPAADGSNKEPLDGDAQALHSLEAELRSTKRELRSVIEELESANEELKVANEEAMSTNEEMQSTNEELETSQEELQSVNEELTTVNHQLQSKVEELEQVNDDLNNLLASTSIPTMFLDRQLKIKRFTPAATRVFSVIPSDVNRPLTDITSVDDIAGVVADAATVLERLTPLERETHTTDGRYYLRRTLPYRTQEDRIDGVVLTFADVTELRSASEGLRRYAAVVQASNDAVIVHDLDGKVLAWNRGAQVMYGYTADQAAQLRIDDLMPQDARAGHYAELQRALQGHAVRAQEQVRTRRDGGRLHVSSSVSIVPGDGGRAQAVSLIERDVTPQREAQLRLQRSEQRFRSLADTAPVLIWISDADGALRFVNQEFAASVGQTAERLSGQRLQELLHRDDRAAIASALAALQVSRSRFSSRVRLTDADGGSRWMLCSAMRQDGEDATIGTMVDIDAQVANERAMQEASQHKDEFLAMLGHELRNPLAPIRNATEVLRRVAGPEPRLTWVHDVLVRQVNHVTRLVDDLLDISLITRGRMELRREPVELGGVLKAVLDDMTPLFERKRHQLNRSFFDEQLWVDGDLIRLQQVFENLLTNAAKYTDDGGLIELDAARSGTQAVVLVRDNGLGLAPDMADRVFDLFVQDARAIDRSQGGLGIGLALVKHLVTMHGGSVTVHSEGIGKGCEFRITLPLLHAAPQVTAPAEPSTLAAPTRGRVLIVDDDREAAESLRMLLELYGYEALAENDLELIRK